MTQVLGGLIVYPLDQAKDLLAFLHDYLPNVPDALTVLVVFLTAPAAPMLPDNLHNTVVVAPAVCFNGSVQEGEQVLQPLRAFGSPTVDFIGPMPYTALQTMFDAQVPPGLHNYYKSVYLQDLSEPTIDVLIERAAHMADRTTQLHDVQLGGAISHVGEEDSAFSHRHMPYECYIPAIWSNPEETDRHIA